ncbi:MAG: hypothetical protein U1E05_24615, partial [Patescibacteria group bacterium]|nr:hypothetical protein [Patescibacteria group bacterium]
MFSSGYLLTVIPIRIHYITLANSSQQINLHNDHSPSVLSLSLSLAMGIRRISPACAVVQDVPVIPAVGLARNG